MDKDNVHGPGLHPASLITLQLQGLWRREHAVVAIGGPVHVFWGTVCGGGAQDDEEEPEVTPVP